MAEIFGEFDDGCENVGGEYLVLCFSPNSIPIKQRWRNNGLSADFLGDYLATFFPADEPDKLLKRNQIKGAIRYIANELLENAMKYNDVTKHYSVNIRFQLYSDHLIFWVSNSISSENITKFKSFIRELSESDPQVMYLQRLKQNIKRNFQEEKHNRSGGIGFLTMINDYNAQLSWKIESFPTEEPIAVVTTRVKIDI